MSISDKNMGAMLSLTLEIEGLLLLLQRRGDLVHPEVATLLNQKIAQLARYAGGIAQAVETPAAPAPVPAPAPAPVVAPAPAPVAEADAEAIAASAEFEEEEHADMPEPEVAPEVIEEPVAAPVAEPAPVVAPAPVVEPEPELKVEVAAPAAAHEPAAPKVVADTMPKFTLNDRFRFRNSLFGGDEKEFSETLSVISAMSSAREVEEYIADDLCLDPANPDVADFLTIVTARFA